MKRVSYQVSVHVIASLPASTAFVPLPVWPKMSQNSDDRYSAFSPEVQGLLAVVVLGLTATALLLVGHLSGHIVLYLNLT